MRDFFYSKNNDRLKKKNSQEKVNLTKEILILLLEGGVALSGAMLIGGPTGVRLLKKFGKHAFYKVKSTLKRLERQRYIERRKKREGELLFLTARGKEKAWLYLAKNFEKVEKWDQRWRLLIFDIPERNRRIRDILRIILKSYNFYRLQKSVFVTPYNHDQLFVCLKNIISEYGDLHLFTIMSLGELEVKIRKKFSL